MTAFDEKPYADFAQFIEAIRVWIHGAGKDSAQLCGCSQPHPYRSPWTSFKMSHFTDDRWNGSYVVHADTRRHALLRLLELVDAGMTAEEIFVPERTPKGTRKARVQGTSSASGLYIYQARVGVPFGEETRACHGRAPAR